VSSSLPSPFDARIAKLSAALHESSVNCLVVSSRENVRYLSGFAGSAGWVLVSDRGMLLATDSRYIERARWDLGESRVSLAANLHTFVASYAAANGFASLGFEGKNLPYADALALQDTVEASAIGCEVRAVDGLVEQLRLVKDAGELSSIQRAAKLADGAILHARAVLRRGMTEGELAWEVERWMREQGSGRMPFDVIVASGPNSALPHAAPGERAISEGEPVVIDLGATFDGYCSDLTRTLFLDHMGPPFDHVYTTVLAAHMAALNDARTGTSASAVDELARTVIREAGLEDCFTHGLGHGVGLEVHERPAVSGRSNETLIDGVVFTIEPGVYLAGQGGVRIEDTVVMRDGKPQSFSRADKTDPIVRVHAGPHGT